MRRAAIVLALFLALPAGAGEITIDSVLEAMNRARAEEGLPPLHHDTRLDAAARDRVADMEAQRYFAHDAPDGRSPFDWLPARGYVFSDAAENLARGFDSVEALVDGWLASSGHRRNILSPVYADCGIAKGSAVVVLFGRERPR
jgi:uncharacterized protein YkwD